MRLVLVVFVGSVLAASAWADPLACSASGYKDAPGLTAVTANDRVAVTWAGERNQQIQAVFAVEGGAPVIRSIGVRNGAGPWTTIATNLKPEYRVVTGVRRMSNQQMVPLREMKVEITPEIIKKYKWDAFWDAPLDMSAPQARGGDFPYPGNPPPADGIAGQPGLPRKPEEIKRASVGFRQVGCSVRSEANRLEVWFTGAELGSFAGRLQYTVYKGSNLLKQEIVAKTQETTVAYKYDTGLSGLPIKRETRALWRDTSNLWQDYSLRGNKNDKEVALKSANRTLVAQLTGGSIAAFPPPHSFFWAREVAINLGYSWYRKDSDTAFAFGIRQAEAEDPKENPANFSLYSARPNTEQHMPMFLYITASGGKAAMEEALAYTRQDRFKAVPGYQVMATHFHTSIPQRLKQLGLDAKLPDFEAIRAAGVNIYAPIDGGRVPANTRLEDLALYFEAARRNSDESFLLMPNEEAERTPVGGHHDVVLSHPSYWTWGRKEGEPFITQDPKYGTVYHIGTEADWLEVARRENLLIYMPHPRAKGSTGYPDSMKDGPLFNSDEYRGIGARWGMGLDGSETRLCEYRCQTLLDDMNNWVADKPGALKYLWAITETYQMDPGDDIYANNPVNYIKLDKLPTPDDMSSIVGALKKGDYFWTSGEVLIPKYEVQGRGEKRTIVADVEWTFPLSFVEVVWGDGTKTDRQIISTASSSAYETRHFEIPFDAAGKKWVRFAAWDVAGNGAMVQPVRVGGPTVAK
jgi:hypothetical protein